jgi:HD-GYP domain-containing protein (c-di-GMP phosphodiesterase class II)
MNKVILFLLFFVCGASWAVEPTLSPTAQTSVLAASQDTPDFPSEAERSEERERLSSERQALEDQYKSDMMQCYQKFDVTNCRLKARERRIQANALLRKEELRFNAQERQIHAIEARRNLAERNSEAEQKKSEAERAAAIAAAKDRADANTQKQIDHALQGTKRGEYDQKQSEAMQHREDVAKKIRERKGEPAAPLPVPNK